MRGLDETTGIEVDRRLARRWLTLAVGSLLLAGLLAVGVAGARTPAVDRLVGDPLLFKRALVVHVDLAMVVWFYAFVAAMFSLIPSGGARSPLARIAPFVSGLGVLLLLVGAAVPGAKPILANYIPMIDHPLYGAGLLTFAAGVVFALWDGRLFAGNERARGVVPLPEAVPPFLRASAISVLCAGLTFFAAWLWTPANLPAEGHYEVLFWGGGHVLQFASVCAMIAAWVWLLTPVLGRSPLSRRDAVVLSVMLVIPPLAAPLVAMQDTTSVAYRTAFTQLMQWGIFPPVLIVLLLCLRALRHAMKQGRAGEAAASDRRVWAFGASAGLAVLGFVLGALIRGSTTMVPAHYHAAIGAVTASFMAMSFVLFEPLGLRLQSPRLLRLSKWQPVLFGGGQAVFALGFGFAGAHGAGRKTYGAEQLQRTLPETIGLGVMAVGGLIAVLAGLLYLSIVVAAWRARRTDARAFAAERSSPWTHLGSTPSRS